MAVLKILQYPEDRHRLNTKAPAVQDFDKNLQKIIDDMFETLYKTKNCAGLAATQLDLKDPKQITVIDVSAEKNQPICLINPTIISVQGATYQEEGCMSVLGGIYDKVERAEIIKVKALDRYGDAFEIETGDFLAKCIQHEIDHLNGMLFIDRLSFLKRKRIDKKFLKWNKR